MRRSQLDFHKYMSWPVTFSYQIEFYFGTHLPLSRFVKKDFLDVFTSFVNSNETFPWFETECYHHKVSF